MKALPNEPMGIERDTELGHDHELKTGGWGCNRPGAEILSRLFEDVMVALGLVEPYGIYREQA